jgi:hypothetical protein
MTYRELRDPEDTAMKALIIYDDLTCAVNTNAVLHRAAHQADVSVKWDIRPWPLNMLEFLPTADPALPPWLMNWLERWAALRQVPDPALAVVGDRDAKSSTATATVDVSRFSRQFGLSFIRRYDEADDDMGILDPVSTERKAVGLRVPPYLGTLSNVNADLVWGIND